MSNMRMFEDLPPVVLYLLSLCLSIVLLLLLIAIGWFLVWKVFLSRFRFVRELVNGNSNENVQSVSGADSGSKEGSVRRRTQRSRME